PVPSTVADLIPALETVLRTRAAHRMPVQRYDVRRPDGSMEVHYWMPLNSPVLDSEGEVRYILHQAEDITAHLMDRAAAEAAEHRASHILERMGDGVLLLDSQLRIVYVNPAGERLMQVPRDRVIGQPARTVFPGVLDPDAERHYERVIS